jgi:pimeloyl-ACP methyl ester carboxylesterase
MRFAGLLLLTAATFAQISRTDFTIAGDQGMRLHLREVRYTPASKVPVLLIHGARVPGVASFDLPELSLAADIAKEGHPVFIVDIRGYGGSTRPAEMERDPASSPPVVRSPEAARDIDAAVDEIRRRTKAQRVALFGWATGGQWAGYYAALHHQKVSRLIMLNSLYGADAPHPYIGRGSSIDDPAHPGQLAASVNAYRCNSAESLTDNWDKSIPIEDKDHWRDPEVVRSYVTEALASDPVSEKRKCFRAPNGALEDSFYMANGRQLYDASLITAPILMVGTEYDFWSRKEDRERLMKHAVHSVRKKVVVILGATHFVHLDRAEHGRDQLLTETLQFLSQ